MAKTETDKAAKRQSRFIAEDFNLQNIELSSEVANGGAFHSMSLRGLFTSITVIENLFHPVNEIRVTLTDAEGFIESFPVVGDEVIELTFSNIHTTSLEEAVNKQRFRVYDLQTNPSEQKFSVYTLYGVSEEYIKNMQKRVCRRYQGLNSSSVKDIVRKYLGYGKDLFVEETKATNSVMIPNWTPFEAINFLASRSMSAAVDEIETDAPEQYQNPTGSFFVFYEKINKGFRFESIETMITKQRDNDKIFYFYAPRGVEGQVLDNVSGMQGVESFKIINTFDTMRNMGRGLYASRLIAYDPIRMKYDIVKYDYFEDASAKKSDENRRFHNFVTMDKKSDKEHKLIGVHSDMLGEHTTMTKLATTTKDHDSLFVPPIGAVGNPTELNSTSIGVTQSTFKDREAKYNNVENWLLQRNAQEQEFDNIRLKMTVAGNASRHVGDLIFFDFPTYLPTDDDFPTFRHQLYGGYYMVTKIEHNISQTRYTMDMEVVKNSMLTDLPGNIEGYKRLEEIQEGLDEIGRAGGGTGRRAMRNTDGSIRIVGGL